jgi:hypothetical protein
VSLLPEQATFHEWVQEYFASLRGRGLALSAADLELVDDWAAREIPFEVVARGIRAATLARGWDSSDDSPLRALISCRRHVEREIVRHLKKRPVESAAMSPAPNFLDERHQHFVEVLSAFARTQSTAGRFLDGFLVTRPTPETFAEARRAEHAAFALIARALPAAERIELEREVRRLASADGVLRPEAHREARRFHRAAILRKQHDLPPFW